MVGLNPPSTQYFEQPDYAFGVGGENDAEIKEFSFDNCLRVRKFLEPFKSHIPAYAAIVYSPESHFRIAEAQEVIIHYSTS